jgi:hypothetical protein
MAVISPFYNISSLNFAVRRGSSIQSTIRPVFSIYRIQQRGRTFLREKRDLMPYLVGKILTNISKTNIFVL